MIKRLLLVSLITLFVNCCFAQKNDTQDDCSHYYDKTTERNVYFNYTSAPVSPDSLPEGYLDYIYRNIKISFDDFIEHASMRPKYRIIIDEDGKVIVCEPLLFNKEEEYTVLDKEVIRIFKESDSCKM